VSNPLGVSDIGYYVGYRIAHSYYAAARDKRLAVEQLIELHYDAPAAVNALIRRSGYLKANGRPARGVSGTGYGHHGTCT
jgi:hypothetical protein